MYDHDNGSPMSLESAREIETLHKWADLVGFPRDQARNLQILMLTRHHQAMCELNGDPHRLSPDPTDKNRNARIWSGLVDSTLKKIHVLVGEHGFTFDPGTGLWGSLKRNGNYMIDMPPPGKDTQKIMTSMGLT